MYQTCTCFALFAFVLPVRLSMLWTREGTLVCSYSFNALADPVHVSMYQTMYMQALQSSLRAVRHVFLPRVGSNHLVVDNDYIFR